MRVLRSAALAAAIAVAAVPAFAQSDAAAEGIARYRELLQDGNPADLWEARGEEQWKQKAGPKQASLEHCDLGKGPGVVKGVYAELPRYFADADRVMDLETRLAWCMQTLQGLTEAEITRQPFGNGDKRSNFEALAAWIVSESRGFKMHAPMQHPKEQQAYRIGEQMFFYRGGPHDFSCATCHGAPGKRIRLQELPNLTDAHDAQRAYTSWPAYRVSQGELRTMQWRLNDCFRQQRFPNLKFTSDASVALATYLAKRADGGEITAPGLKR